MTFSDTNGTVTVFEEGTVPFPVRRVFYVEASGGKIRGAHAHRACQQLLVAISGEIIITVNDGITETIHQLTNSTKGLVIPAMVWASQQYEGADAKLLVICDQLFDETDYIRDFAEFTSLVGQSIP
ncbi:MAG: TDP-4-oxo-6-deoxy-alpha-D-glucose-3,4-oxoisomerase [Nitrospira sp.]|nr:TDP-4-oxo-6-deoxy-alpha-D-glucose-3,4-oxoisomerase [Nitrospira sp.]